MLAIVCADFQIIICGACCAASSVHVNASSTMYEGLHDAHIDAHTMVTCMFGILA